MKRLQCFAFLLSFGLFLYLLAAAGYYRIHYTVLNGSFWSPVMVLEPLQVDFGDVSVTDDIHREIAVKNTGWSSLTLKRVQPSCSSCLVIHSYTKEPIPPGRQGRIEFSLDVSKRDGKVNTSFIVVSNIESQTLVVKVTANVLTEDK